MKEHGNVLELLGVLKSSRPKSGTSIKHLYTLFSEIRPITAGRSGLSRLSSDLDPTRTSTTPSEYIRPFIPSGYLASSCLAHLVVLRRRESRSVPTP